MFHKFVVSNKNNTNMNKQSFYQKNSGGKIKEWTIEVVRYKNKSDIIVTHGLMGGKMQEEITPIYEGKNIGKTNETSVYEQACFDAQTKINKQIKKGYVTDVNNVKESNERATIKAPMKAYKYHPRSVNGGLTLSDLKIKDKEVVVQVKLDGWRMRIKVDANEITFYSSSGDVVLPFPQIERSIRKTFDKIYDYVNQKYGVEEYYLDGEIYLHSKKINDKGEVCGENEFGGFQNVASACATQVHITPEKQELRDRMQFYIFDVCLQSPYSIREKVINYFVDNEYVMKVESHHIKANDEEIKMYFEKFLSQGYEGLMIRQLDMPYEFKRTKQIVKYKPLMDDEFQIVGFKKSITGETLGSFECSLPDGRRFFANPKDTFGTEKMKKEIWEHKKDYIGKWITIEFLEYTNDRILRHPRAKGFRKAKSID